ncbi:MAG TPA: hypothetical protein VLE48_02700 [Terriglobales bacterium]|nr:hypothetical protein [Terriglobales bacterium]
MRRRRRLIIALAVLLVVAALAAVVVMRKKAPPESVQLLPDAEAVVHVNFRLMRRLGAMEGFSESVPEEEYKTFVQATGIRFERDLDEMSIAVHAPAAPPARTGATTGDNKGARGRGTRPEEAVAAEAEGETRFSHVFVGRYDSAKLAAYLKKLAVASEKYRDLEILLIPSEERTVRAAILGVDTVAVSNAESGQPIRDIIDHYKARAAPYAGPALVREYYPRVPRGSLVWAMARWSEGKQPVALGGPLELTLPAGVAWVGSLRFLLGDVQLRVEAHAGSEVEARQVSDQLTNLLTLYRNLWGAQVADPDLQALIQSVEVRQEQQRAVVTASLSQALLKKALGEPAAPPAPAVEEKPAGK